MKEIRIFKDLEGLETDEYYVELKTMHEDCVVSANVRRKSDKSRVLYLSTHTFYISRSAYCTKALNELGFEVKIIGY
ncbi:MAG: hypothetical protein ACRCZ0_04235 [Cetobacterium sp.]